MDKRKIRILTWLLLCVVLFSMPVHAATTTVKIAKGGTKQLKVSGTVIKKAVSSNKAVAVVNGSGKVTAKKKGSATVTVTDQKNKKHKFLIKVEAPLLNKKTVTINQGKTFALKLNNNTQKVTWSTSKKSVATVSAKGVIAGKTAGKAVIKARIANGPVYKCTVTVKKVKPTLTKLTASEQDLQAGTSTTVTFTVKASVSVTKTIKLYGSNGKAVATMNDNGTKGDSKKGDRIFTCQVKINRSTAGTSTYYAKAGTVKSGTVSLQSYAKPTQESKEAVVQAAESLGAVDDKYENAGGYIDAADVPKALAEVAAKAKSMCSSGEAVRYNVGSDSVICKLKSGLTVVYQPRIEGVDSIGDDVSMSVITMQPCLSTYSGLDSYMKLPDKAANAIASEFSNYSFDTSNNIDDGAVSLDRIKSIGANQVVIWHGHGGNDPRYNSFLVTGEEFNWDKWLWDPVYWWDCVQDRILESSEGRAMVTSKYITKYCGNMTNSLIYLAACQSGKDNVLANAFLSKGASAVVANSETIYTVYNTKMENTILTTMTKVNASTENYYTLSEALAEAKRQHGEDDGSEHNAKPLIFGGTTAQQYRFGDVKPGKIVGQICRADDRSTPIANASINIYKNGSLQTALASDSSGNYSVELMPATYQVVITADGFIRFQCYATVASKRTEYMETFLMVDGTADDTGIANGYIKNSLTGAGVSDVRVDIRNDWNNPSIGNVVSTLTTDASGWYTTELPLGNYTVTASKAGFVTNSFNITVQKNSSRTQSGAISPEDAGDNYQIVLTWGENPRDLDSHVVGTFSNGSTFHTYYSSKNAYENGVLVCNLDVDDTTSYGPETTTLRVSNTTPYYYYIYRYAGSGYLYTSGAQIKVYQTGHLIATYNVPTNQGSGDYWNVFAIVNGRIVTKNTITSSADVTYAASNTAVNAQARMMASSAKPK